MTNQLDGPSPTPLGAARALTAGDVEKFVVRELMYQGRSKPIVALTTWPDERGFPIDPQALAASLGDRADVVALRTGDDTWALSAALPKRLDVYGGASRIWWPGLLPNSDPLAHPLLFAFSSREAAVVARRIVAAVCDGDARAGAYGPWTPPSDVTAERAPPPKPESVRVAVVTKLVGDEVHVDAEGALGVVTEADAPLADVARDVSPGQRLRVRKIGARGDGEAAFSIRGLRVDPWERLPEVYSVGDVVRGRVCRINGTYVLVEVLPGAALIVLQRELDWTDRRDPAEIFKLGERVNAKILTLDPPRRKGSASIKQAYLNAVRPAASPGPGLPPFLADEGESELPASDDGAAARAAQLAEELDSALTDRTELMSQLRVAKEQNVDLRRELRSVEDRLVAMELRAAGDIDPLASEAAFLTAVRVEYARRCDEGDRERYPLARMRVGRAFLGALRGLDGIPVAKVVEVCAQVASQRAHEVSGRKVHQLRSGEAGAPTRVRKRDGAKASRCSLQDNTASARRLHWWDVPGGEGRGRTIEFATVGVHDEMDIPE